MRCRLMSIVLMAAVAGTASATPIEIGWEPSGDGAFLTLAGEGYVLGAQFAILSDGDAGTGIEGTALYPSSTPAFPNLGGGWNADRFDGRAVFGWTAQAPYGEDQMFELTATPRRFAFFWPNGISTQFTVIDGGYPPTAAVYLGGEFELAGLPASIQLPEPGTAAMLGLWYVGVLARRRRR